MDLKQLEYFVHIAELGSFTRAATVLRVAQPALSRQVRSLEVELRQPLFDRNGRGVTLTEAGKRLLAHGRGILQQVERARQDLEDQRGAASGHLAIGLPPSVSRTLTGPLVEAFRRRFPKATLTMVEGLSTYALEWLVLGRIDCAVVYNVAPAAAIELVPVLDEPLFLVSARPTSDAQPVGKPVSLAQLAQHELVMPSRPHSIRMLLETALAGAGLKPRIELEIDSVPAMLDLVERNPLHAVLSLNALRGREEAFVARPIASSRGEPPLAARLWIATSAQRPSGPLVEQGTALLGEMLHELWGSPRAA
ncbi:MAG: LysR family transcriptional regulator [Rubrivivax sp. SCN 70-15]|mgnify:CR=1 FL=1|nr:MAG: LysR family transcriptional regulator [Rubrivivax sp. SCN 70-15]